MANCLRCGARIAPNLDGTCDELCYDCKNSQNTKGGSDQNYDMSFQINDTQEYESHLNGGNLLYGNLPYKDAPNTETPDIQDVNTMTLLLGSDFQEQEDTMNLLRRTSEYHFDKIKDSPLTAMPFPGNFSVTDTSNGSNKEYEISLSCYTNFTDIKYVFITSVFVIVIGVIMGMIFVFAADMRELGIFFFIMFCGVGVYSLIGNFSMLGKNNFLRLSDTLLISCFGKTFGSGSGKYHTISRNEAVKLSVRAHMNYDIIIKTNMEKLLVARNVPAEDASFLYQFLVWYFTAKEPLV